VFSPLENSDRQLTKVLEEVLKRQIVRGVMGNWEARDGVNRTHVDLERKVREMSYRCWGALDDFIGDGLVQVRDGKNLDLLHSAVLEGQSHASTDYSLGAGFNLGLLDNWPELLKLEGADDGPDFSDWCG
jgi:hypothetical protein